MIGERIKSKRLALGLSQKILAEQAGIAQQTVHSLESGRSNSTKALVKLAHALGTTPEWLETGDSEWQIADTLSLYGAANSNTTPLVGIPIVGDTHNGYDPQWLARNCPASWGKAVLNVLSHDHTTHALRVLGSQYQPRLLEGEMVTVSRQVDCVPGEDVVLQLIDNTVLIRQLVSQRDHEITVMGIGLEQERRIIPSQQVKNLYAITGIHPSSLLISIPTNQNGEAPDSHSRSE